MRRSGQQGRLLLQPLHVGCEARCPSVVAHECERCDLVHLELVTHHNGELVLLPSISALQQGRRGCGCAPAALTSSTQLWGHFDTGRG